MNWDLIISYLQVNKWACCCFMDSSRNMSLLHQRQRTLLLVTQEATWTSACSQRFPLPPSRAPNSILSSEHSLLLKLHRIPGLFTLLHHGFISCNLFALLNMYWVVSRLGTLLGNESSHFPHPRKKTWRNLQQVFLSQVFTTMEVNDVMWFFKEVNKMLYYHTKLNL